MSFIKKYSILLIPVGIVLAAGVVIVLTILTSRSLGNEIDENSLRQNGQVTLLLRNPHSERQPEVEKMRQDQHTNDIKGVVNLATQCTLRELINYGVFPPTDDSQQLFDEYGQDYSLAVESLVRSMQALDAPSDMEIRSALNESMQTASGGAGRYRGMGYGGYSNRTGLSGAMRGNDNTRKAMLDAICSKRAEEIRVYANPNLFKWYAYWGDFQYVGAEPAIQDCWYSQLAYWICEDVVATINNLNTDSQNVYSSPVKRLLGVSFREAVDYPKITGRVGYGGIVAAVRRYTRGDYNDGEFSSRGDAPEYIRYAEGGVLGVETWMGRVCNDDIDVVHFSVGVITSSSAVMSFMEELCSAKDHVYRKGYKKDGEQVTFQHNQVSILKSEVIAVERDAPENANYRYGDEAVVRLDLVCEYIFNRVGYDKIKPESIKVRLGQAEPEEGTPGAPSLGRGAIQPGVRTTAPSTGTDMRGRGLDDE